MSAYDELCNLLNYYRDRYEKAVALNIDINSKYYDVYYEVRRRYRALQIFVNMIYGLQYSYNEKEYVMSNIYRILYELDIIDKSTGKVKVIKGYPLEFKGVYNNAKDTMVTFIYLDTHKNIPKTEQDSLLTDALSKLMLFYLATREVLYKAQDKESA